MDRIHWISCYCTLLTGAYAHYPASLIMRSVLTLPAYFIQYHNTKANTDTKLTEYFETAVLHVYSRWPSQF